MSGRKGARFDARECRVCGKIFAPSNGRQKYCQYCAALVKRYSHTSDPVFAAKRAMFGADRPHDFEYAKGCRGCIYWRSLGGCFACHYALDNYERRPCPPGDGCVVRKESVRHRVRTKRSNPAGYATILAKVKL